MKLPKKLYVRWDGEGKEAWLQAEQSATSCLENGTPVGIYQLKEIKKVKVDVSLV